jgi:hypothetical protein
MSRADKVKKSLPRRKIQSQLARMKKLLTLVVMAELVCAGLLTGCQKQEEASPEMPSTNAPEMPATNASEMPSAEMPSTNAPEMPSTNAPEAPATNAP